MKNLSTSVLLYIRKCITNPIFFVILTSVLLIIDPLVQNGTFSGHDIDANIIYFGSFYDSLKEGNVIPRWSGNIANLYGSPTNIFFYPLSFYLSAIPRFIGFTLVDSMKYFIVFSFIASAVLMYIFLKRHFSTIASFTGAFLYIYAPYRINDIYARGSVAENTAFMFLPLVLLLLYNLWQKSNYRSAIILSLGTSALILSHPFMLIVFGPLLIGYCIYLGISVKKIKLLVLSAVVSIGLTSFYIFPLLIENKYTHYDISPFNGLHYYKQFITPQKLIIPEWYFIDSKGKLEYQTYQIGFLQIGIFIAGLIALVGMLGKKNKHNKLLSVSLVVAALGVFLILSASDPIYKIITPIQRIEFPWRFMALNVTALVIVGAILVETIKNKLLKISLVSVIVITGIILYLPHAKGHDYKMVSDSYYLYEIVENIDGFATLPMWAAQPNIYQRNPNRYKIIEGKADVTVLSRNSVEHIYNTDGGAVKFEDSTFYFPGWEVYIDNVQVGIEFQNPAHRGIITFEIPPGKHTVRVIFTGTRVRKVADWISAISIIIVLFILIVKRKK